MKQFAKRAGAILLAGIMAIGSAALSLAAGPSAPVETEAAGKVRYDEYFNLPNIYDWLKDHQERGYYTGTFYFPGGVDHPYNTNVMAAHDPAYDGANNGFNCTGFLSRVFWDSETNGAAYPGDANFNAFFVSHGWPDHGTANSTANATQLMSGFYGKDAAGNIVVPHANEIEYYYFDSTSSMIAG